MSIKFCEIFYLQQFFIIRPSSGMRFRFILRDTHGTHYLLLEQQSLNVS